MSGGLTPEQMLEHSFLDANEGLMPRLANDIGANFQRFQAKPWSFNGVFEGAGFRILRPTHTQNTNTVNAELALVVRVGYLLEIDDPSISEIEGGKLAIQMDRTIFCWSKESRMVRALSLIDGFNEAKQDKDISSGNPKAWYTVVVREFTPHYDWYL